MRGFCFILLVLLSASAKADHNFFVLASDGPAVSFRLPDVCQCDNCDCEDCDGKCQTKNAVTPITVAPVVTLQPATAVTYQMVTRRRYVRRGLRGGYWQTYQVRVPVTPSTLPALSTPKMVCADGVCRVVE